MGGVVDEDVYLAELLLCGFDGALPVVLAGDVEVEIDRFAAEFADFGLHLHTEFIAHVADDDLCALLGEHSGLGGALPARAAGDDRNLAFQPHGVASVLMSFSSFSSSISSLIYSPLKIPSNNDANTRGKKSGLPTESRRRRCFDWWGRRVDS